MDKSKKLLAIMKEYLKGQTKAASFAEEYEFFFEDYESLIKKETNNEIYETFSRLHLDVAYFEPHSEIRKEDLSYFDENELIRKVKKAYNKIRKEMKKTITVKKINKKLLEKLMFFHGQDIINFLNENNIDIGSWSPPYTYEERLHFAITAIEKIPKNIILKFISSHKSIEDGGKLN